MPAGARLEVLHDLVTASPSAMPAGGPPDRQPCKEAASHFAMLVGVRSDLRTRIPRPLVLAIPLSVPHRGGRSGRPKSLQTGALSSATLVDEPSVRVNLPRVHPRAEPNSAIPAVDPPARCLIARTPRALQTRALQTRALQARALQARELPARAPPARLLRRANPSDEFLSGPGVTFPEFPKSRRSLGYRVAFLATAERIDPPIPGQIIGSRSLLASRIFCPAGTFRSPRSAQ